MDSVLSRAEQQQQQQKMYQIFLLKAEGFVVVVWFSGGIFACLFMIEKTKWR